MSHDNLHAYVNLPGDERPRRLADLGRLVYGDRFRLFDKEGFVGFKFKTDEPKLLSECLEDDAQIALPTSKVRGMLRTDQRIHITFEIAVYAVRRAVDIIGRTNATRLAKAKPGEAPVLMTLTDIFGDPRS